MARLSRTTRLIVALGALALLGALGLGFTLLRPAEEENPWEFLGPADRDVTSLVFDPTTPTTLYAATRFGGVYKSEDGGATWRYLRGSGFRGRSLAIAPTTPSHAVFLRCWRRVQERRRRGNLARGQPGVEAGGEEMGVCAVHRPDEPPRSLRRNRHRRVQEYRRRGKLARGQPGVGVGGEELGVCAVRRPHEPPRGLRRNWHWRVQE
jgi:hypothetical protein